MPRNSRSLPPLTNSQVGVIFRDAHRLCGSGLNKRMRLTKHAGLRNEEIVEGFVEGF
jgi:hypothetical protein